MLTAFNIDEICEDYTDFNLFERLESVIKRLQEDDEGVKRKSDKKFLGLSQYDTFIGAEFVRSLQRILDISETAEALNLGNLLLHHGYIYPSDSHSSRQSIKEDTTHFRFQNPKYWPSQKPNGTEEEYAVYLVKKKMLAKGKNGLHQNELAYFAKLLELFGTRWSHVVKTAEEQYKVLKEKKKTERILISREEEAFWRVHRPREDETNVFDAGHKQYTNRFSRKDLRTLSTVQTEVNALKEKTRLIRIPTSVATNNLVCHCDVHKTIDLLLDPKSELASSSKWLKDFVPRTLVLDSLRLEKWHISLSDLLSDPKGIEELDKFLKKEFSEENLRFWLHCEDLRYAPKSKIKNTVIRIYRDFMAPGARFEINVDNKAMQDIRDGIRNPSRFAFDLAQSQIFSLMSTDSYPRFLKSEQYQNLVSKARNAKVTNTRKSNNRLLEAARVFVKRPSLNDIKPHIKLGRSSSDFPGPSSSQSFGTSCFYLEPNANLDRSKSENDLTKLDEVSNPGTPIPTRSGLKPPVLKGLPVLKLSRSVTPNESPVGSPSYQSSFGWKISPMSSPRGSRKYFNISKENDKKPYQTRKTSRFACHAAKSSPLSLNELEEKLTAVKTNRDKEGSQDLDDWHWEKISHDFS